MEHETRTRFLTFLKDNGFGSQKYNGQYIVRKKQMPDDTQEIFIRQIPERTRDYELFYVLHRLGGLCEMRLLLRHSMLNRSMAYAKFESGYAFQRAMSLLNETIIFDSRLVAIPSYDKKVIAIKDVPAHFQDKVVECVFNQEKVLVPKKIYLVSTNAYLAFAKSNFYIEYRTHLAATMARKILELELKSIYRLRAEFVNPKMQNYLAEHQSTVELNENGALVITQLQQPQAQQVANTPLMRAILGRAQISRRAIPNPPQFGGGARREMAAGVAQRNGMQLPLNGYAGGAIDTQEDYAGEERTAFTKYERSKYVEAQLGDGYAQLSAVVVDTNDDLAGEERFALGNYVRSKQHQQQQQQQRAQFRPFAMPLAVQNVVAPEPGPAAAVDLTGVVRDYNDNIVGPDDALQQILKNIGTILS